jgi:hypothetical protein
MAAVIENENTKAYTTSPTKSDQRNPTTRMVRLIDVSGNTETLEIERNVEFHTTIVQRLKAPRRLVDAADVDDE